GHELFPPQEIGLGDEEGPLPCSGSGAKGQGTASRPRWRARASQDWAWGSAVGLWLMARASRLASTPDSSGSRAAEETKPRSTGWSPVRQRATSAPTRA